MFPEGGPGVALLLLRLSVASTFFVNASSRWGVSASVWLFPGVVVVSLLLCIGFLTPYVSVIACLTLAASLARAAHTDAPWLIAAVLEAAALALLGPGAYSVDGRLFGRRVLIVPQRKSSDDI